jgi:hypothetical protein
VHHAVITADTTGNYTSDLSGACYNIPGNLGIGTYAPGTKATVFPSKAPLKAGIYLKAGSKIIIQLHYPAGSIGETDSTKIRLFFYPEGSTDVRRIYSATPLQNWQMAIPANSVMPYTAYYPSASNGLPVAWSVYGLMPHSHLLCTSIINYAVNPGVDTIPLIRINNWDFEWQDYYLCKKLVKVPAGYRLFGRHVFDNTLNNPHNPNSPPQMIVAGTDTDDEMFFDGMLFMAYQPGDELIDVEAIINNDPLLSVNEPGKLRLNLSAFPNPFNKKITVKCSLLAVSDVNVQVTDLLGKVVLSFDHHGMPAGENIFELDGHSLDGIYFLTVKTSSENNCIKIVAKK